MIFLDQIQWLYMVDRKPILLLATEYISILVFCIPLKRWRDSCMSPEGFRAA